MRTEPSLIDSITAEGGNSKPNDPGIETDLEAIQTDTRITSPLAHWREDLLVGLGLFLLYLALGGYIAIARSYLPGDAVARLFSAYLVFNGTEAKLTSIGFVWPPIPTLLIVPLTLIRPLVDSWMALVIVSAFFMAAAAVIVGQTATLAGVGSWWRRVLVFLFATNPLMLAFGINGMSEAILIAVALAGFYWLLRFTLTDRDGDLISAAALFGLLPLIRYEMALLTAGAGFLLALPIFRALSNDEDGYVEEDIEDGKKPWSIFQGRFIAYVTLASYPLIVWALISWQIMGSPLYFLINDRSALNASQIDLGGQQSTLADSLPLVFGIWVSAFPASIPACLVALAIAVYRRSPFLAGLSLLPMVIPFAQGLLLSKGLTVPLVRYFIMSVPLTFLVSLVAYQRLNTPLPRRPSEAEMPDGTETSIQTARTAHRFLCLLLVAVIGSSYASGLLLSDGRYQDFEHETWISLTTQEKVEDQRIPETMEVGRIIARLVPDGSMVLADEYQYGYAAMLGSKNTKMFVNHTHPDYEKALNEPWNYVDYILVCSPEGRGALYSVNLFQPDLYYEGAPWAELVDELPPTDVGWKLYRVKRDQGSPNQNPANSVPEAS
ncbi:MAG: hypothetical protein ACOX87_02790 [Chloroflexota bacterium]